MFALTFEEFKTLGGKYFKENDSAMFDRLKYKAIKQIYHAVNQKVIPNEKADDVKYLLVELIQLHKLNDRDIKSVNNDGYSVTYNLTETSEFESACYQLCLDYLGAELCYLGVDM